MLNIWVDSEEVDYGCLKRQILPTVSFEWIVSSLSIKAYMFMCLFMCTLHIYTPEKSF